MPSEFPQLDDWAAALNALTPVPPEPEPAPVALDAPAPVVSVTTVPETFEAPEPAPVPQPQPPTVRPGPQASGLSQTAVLVDFTRTGWSASVRDKAVTDAVIQQAGAQTTAGHFHKKLMPDKAPAMEAVRAAIQNAYEDYRSRTAPWLDSGTRIMSTNGFQDFTASQREHAGRIEAAKRVLRAEYDAEVQKQRASLGALFNEADYPTADEVVSRFNAGYRVLPVPDSKTDFRMAVGDAERDALKQAYDEYTAEMVKANRRDLAARVDKEVRHLADRMKTYTGGQTGSFRDTLIENVRRMADMLDSINITGDPEVSTLADRIKTELCSASVAELREDRDQRADLAKKADAILADMSAFIA